MPSDLPEVREWERSTTAKQREVRAEAAIAALKKQYDEELVALREQAQAAHRERDRFQKALTQLTRHPKSKLDDVIEAYFARNRDLEVENAALTTALEEAQTAWQNQCADNLALEAENAALRGEVEAANTTMLAMRGQREEQRDRADRAEADTTALREQYEREVRESFRYSKLWNHAETQNATLRADLGRLKSAAAGRGMVSEMTDMAEVAVLVCGLHDEIARLRHRLHQAGVATGEGDKP
jgi:chromosome segregation ATPase